MSERAEYREKESIWKSRLFKGGVVAAVIGAAAGISVIAEVGVIAVGAGAGWNWAFGKGKK